MYFKKFCSELRFTHDELVCILHAIQNQIDYLKGLFEDWYPLSDQEIQHYKERADELQLLISLEKDFSDELRRLIIT